jgi:2-C-methyl-D-erythritol 4-phosphate cytidylyltransferase/2-C-methyl-D-erythritol 2,4-cyclodiphosphate synthase
VTAACAALIVAAGRGERLGGGTAKQYLALGGEPMVRRSVRAFVAHPGVDAVRVVIHPDDRDMYAAAVAGIDLLDPAPGGAARQDSVRLGLESLASLAPARVLIHDAARPLVDEALITRVIDALADAPAAVPALPVADTLKRGDGKTVGETVDRAGLWRAQTPQGFDFAAIFKAHEVLAGERLTDDAAVAERAGLAVAMVAGAETNFKVTTAEDLARAQAMLGAAGDVRTGNGFDVHRFEPGDHVMLCGVRVPHDRGLAGHSDADAGLHALTDALLGAIGAGDIGVYFPPSEAKWRDAPSEIFVREACDLIAERGGHIVNVDLLLICERPKIGPHRAAMRARIAEICGIDPARVNVKATTTEELGFTGRREGIAAQAVATVRL